MIYLLADEMNDWSILEGISAEASEIINLKGLKGACAPRPLVWCWVEGTNIFSGFQGYDQDLWHYSIALPEGNTGLESIQERWRQDDAEEFQIVDLEFLNRIAKGHEYEDEYREMYGDDWAIYILSDQGWKIVDRRN